MRCHLHVAVYADGDADLPLRTAGVPCSLEGDLDLAAVLRAGDTDLYLREALEEALEVLDSLLASDATDFVSRKSSMSICVMDRVFL